MQLAKQSTSKAAPKRRTPKRSAHAGTMQAIHATWRKVAPPTVVDAEDLRTERLSFAARVLNLNKPLESLSGLSGAQLGRVLDAMRELERATSRPAAPHGVPTVDRRPSTVEIHHLATTAQVEAIDKLFDYLCWTTEGREGFLENKFRMTSRRMLTPVQANACMRILFNIAASRDLRARGAERATQAMIRAEIPALKRLLGIDQGKDIK